MPDHEGNYLATLAKPESHGVVVPTPLHAYEHGNAELIDPTPGSALVGDSRSGGRPVEESSSKA